MGGNGSGCRVLVIVKMKEGVMVGVRGGDNSVGDEEGCRWVAGEGEKRMMVIVNVKIGVKERRGRGEEGEDEDDVDDEEGKEEVEEM